MRNALLRGRAALEAEATRREAFRERDSEQLDNVLWNQMGWRKELPNQTAGLQTLVLFRPSSTCAGSLNWLLNCIVASPSKQALLV